MRVILFLFGLILFATPALAAITVGDPFPEPGPPKDPEQICVSITNDGATDEKVHVSLYDVQVGGAMPSAKAKYSSEGTTQEVTIPAKHTVRRGTATVEYGGNLRVCWKAIPILGHTYWAVAGNKLDKAGDVPVSEGTYGSFTYERKESSEAKAH